MAFAATHNSAGWLHCKYVCACVLRLTASVQSNVAADGDSEAIGGNRHWLEIVDDLWTEKFPHLRDEGNFLFILCMLLRFVISLSLSSHCPYVCMCSYNFHRTNIH